MEQWQSGTSIQALYFPKLLAAMMLLALLFRRVRILSLLAQDISHPIATMVIFSLASSTAGGTSFFILLILLGIAQYLS